MLFALQDSSRQVRALLALLFVFQGKRFNSKVCNWAYSGWQEDAPVSAVDPSSSWAAAGASDPVSLARLRQSSQLLILAPVQGSPLLQTQQQDPCMRKALHTWRLLLPPWGAAATHTAPACSFCRLFTLFHHLSGLSIKPCHEAAVLWLLQIFQTIYPLLS